MSKEWMEILKGILIIINENNLDNNFGNMKAIKKWFL